MTQQQTTEQLLPPAPTLAELESRECTPLELQAALVKMIKLFNSETSLIEQALQGKQPREWRATI